MRSYYPDEFIDAKCKGPTGNLKIQAIKADAGLIYQKFVWVHVSCEAQQKDEKGIFICTNDPNKPRCRYETMRCRQMMAELFPSINPVQPYWDERDKR
ncbi:Uncharacterised protein [uncultured archaeon]|nr:Uncharacterised protein [uncultured archaeon]